MNQARKLNRGVFVVIGVLAMLMVGVINAWSVMSGPIGLSHPEWPMARLSLTFTIIMALFSCGNLVTGFLVKRIRPNVLVILSAALFCAGFLISSMTQDSLLLLYIGLGIMCGLAAGLAFNTIVSTLSAWFPDRQGLISGLMIMGFAISSFVIGRIYAAVTPSDGSMSWCVTFRYMAIIIGVVLLVCSFFFVMPGEDFVPPEPKRERRQKEIREPAIEAETGKMVRMPSFWLTYVWMLMTGVCGITLLGHANGIATQVAPYRSTGTIATVVGMIAILSAVGCVAYGEMFDRMGHRFPLVLILISFALSALLMIFALISSNFILLIVGFIIGGFGQGGITPTASALVSDFYGRSHFALNFSIIMTAGFFTSLASTISGRLYDMSQSYMSTMIMMIIVVVVGFFAWLGIRRPKAQS